MASVAKIKKSLISQLENNNAKVDHFLGLIDDYIWFCKQEKAMKDDIKDRGLFFQTKSASGFLIEKANPSLKNAKMYNEHKLKILKQLGLEAKDAVEDKDEEL